MAAKKIQRQWRVFAIRSKGDRIFNKVKHTSSSLVQKYLKGLKIAKVYEHVYVKIRLDDNLAFFDKMGDKRKTDS